ncbi:MAG: hypothetical protein IMY86_03440, partial [Chloroflexi bacterium]|nr:hypothetical protein [Chloroflexota bacterium]
MAIGTRHLTQAMLVGLVLVLSAGCAASPVPTVALTATPTVPPAPTHAHTPTLPSSPSPTHTHTPTLPPSPSPTPLPPTSASPLGPWQPLPTDGLPGPWVSDITFATPEIVFIVAGGNVYRSDDGGITWVESFSIYRMVQSIAVSPEFDADQTVFAVDGASRLFRSADGGGAWEEMTRIAHIGGASDAEVWLSISPIFPADPTLWAVASGTAYRSSDGGQTWEPFDPGVEFGWTVRLVPNPDY